MTQVLAVDWDQREARYVLGSIRGKTLGVSVVDSVPIVDVAEGGGEPQPDLEASLASALGRHKVGRVKALIGVPRSSIELLNLALPPAGNDELPEMVAIQAMRESSNVSEDWALDFLPMDDKASGPREVIAVALPPEEMERIRQGCQAAGVSPLHMVLRPFATASLFLRKAAAEEEAVLLVNSVGDEVDLIAIAEGSIVFSRTARLPEAASHEELLTEVKRTLAVMPTSRLSSDGVECVYIVGDSDSEQDLLDRIEEETSHPAKVFDPFVALGVPDDQIPPGRGRFASLLGMLLDEATGKHAIDFLHPREIPRPVSRWRVAAIAGGAVAALVVVVAFHMWSTLSEINGTNRGLRERRDQLNKTIRSALVLKKRIDAIAEWKTNEVIWLDELRDLSIRFPSSRDAVLMRMSMRPSQSAGGVVDVQGLVRDPKVVGSMESQIRDKYRRVRSPRIQERMVEKDYTWVFESSISVAKRSKEQYLSHLPKEQQPVETPDTLAAVDPGGDSSQERQ